MACFLLSCTYIHALSLSLFHTHILFSHFFVFSLCAFSLQMNLTLKFPNWRKASVAAAPHVTAFFSPWQCCSCLLSFCPSDCHHEWHFMHSWTTLSKGLCIHQPQVCNVKVSRNTVEVQQNHNQKDTEEKNPSTLLTELKKKKKKGEAFLLS